LLAELENSNPQRIFPASGFLGKTYALRLRAASLLYPAVWDGEWEDMTETE
jgi:hypothetical protein